MTPRRTSSWVCWLMMMTVVTAATSTRESQQQGFLGHLLSRLSDLPVIGNFLRADVHPIYRPLVRQFQPSISNREEHELTNLCYGELGCINTHDDFFHPIHRPLNLPPNRREEINVLLTVHSREDKQGRVVEAMDVTQVLNTTFNPKRKTKMIIHGFLETNTETWMWDMVRALLAYDDFNVVTVDWSGGSQALYSQATANTRVVGLEVAHFINWLKDNLDLDPRDVHIIGHSLGSHTAGYAGERVFGLGRITGLDPAEPFFQYMPPSVRLDPSDALFVDVIHTDADSILNLGTGFGLRQPVGHLDFYPNDGRSQPGCDSLRRVPLTALTDGASLYEGLDAAQKELVACNHFRAPKLFTDSILSRCPYMAFQCTSYRQYLNGECVSCGEDGSRCARMGFHADTWPGRNMSFVSLYASTSAGPHYCIYHYRLTLQVADSTRMMSTLRGNLRVSFFADDGSLRDFDVTPETPKTFTHGKRYTFFLHHQDDLGSSSEALVQWTYKTDLFNPMSYCLLFCDTVFPLARLAFASVDSIVAGSRLREADASREPNEVVMCHQQGLEVVKIASETTVKVVSSPSCLTIDNNSTHYSNNTTTAGLLNAGLASLSSLFNLNLV